MCNSAPTVASSSEQQQQQQQRIVSALLAHHVLLAQCHWCCRNSKSITGHGMYSAL
jgi:hypothetical protein